MNKFKFIADNKIVDNINEIKSNRFCIDYKKNFKFVFASGTYPFENIVQERDEDVVRSDYRDGLQRASSLGGQIVKSDINESVTRQLKEMIAIVRKNETLLYLRMNKATNNKFRMYYCYEASYPPRQLTVEDREVGKIIGSIMGVKIAQDESVENDIVIPMVKSASSKTKFTKIFV
jgi:hypothetical protein